MSSRRNNRHTADARVLELRIHGVNNTPPHAMLDLPADAVEQVAGDDLGSFWRRRQASQPLRNERGYTPEGVIREAYSWGGLARLSLAAGSGVAGAVLGAFVRVLWTLLLPFALVNVAYWSRRLHYGAPGPAEKEELPAFVPLQRRRAGGAWVFRVGGLALTLIVVVTALVLSVDLVAVQCIPARNTKSLCTGIPDALGFLDGWSPGQRIGAMSVVPVGLVIALYLLSSRTRTRFERATRNQNPDPNAMGYYPTSASGRPRWPLLATPGFWNHSSVSAPAAATHLAAAVTLVAGLCSRHLWERGAAFTPVWVSLSIVAVLVLGWAVWVQGRLDPLAADVANTQPTAPTEGAPAQTGSALAGKCSMQANRVLIVAWGLYVSFLIGAAALDTWGARGFKDRDDPAAGAVPMTATHMTLTALVALVVAIIVVALSVRRDALTPKGGLSRSVRQALLGLPFVAAVVLLPVWPVWGWRVEELSVAGLPVGSWLGENAPMTVTVALVVGCVTTWFAYRRSGSLPRSEKGRPTPPPVEDPASTGWEGRAPGIFLALGLVLGLLIMSALVLTVGDRLNENNSAGSLISLPATTAAARGAVDLVVPSLYGWFALAAAGGLIVMAITVGLVYAFRWRGKETDGPWPAPPRATGAPAARDLPGGACSDSDRQDPMATMVFGARRRARLAHRAEPLLGLLLACVAGGTLAISGLRQYEPLARSVYWANFVTAAALILTAVALAAVTGGGTAASGRSGRPLGVLWDLACAVPKAVHPLGPPSYGERVVPEVLSRCQWWLSEEGRHSTDLATSPRAVVLSAHSLGGVISVAAVLGAPRPEGATPGALPTKEEYGYWMVPRMALITYGTQLRAYFSRFFPELFGPAVLGVRAAPRARLLDPDPWFGDWFKEQPSTFEPPTPLPGSVRHILSLQPNADPGPTRWYSLWHLTDYLGFPLVARPAADLMDTEDERWKQLNDAYADEIDHTAYLLSVLTHSDYPRTDAYEAALTSALAAFSPATEGGASRPGIGE